MPNSSDPNFVVRTCKNIEVYRKAIVEYDCNRMRQNVVYDCVKTAK